MSAFLVLLSFFSYSAFKMNQFFLPFLTRMYLPSSKNDESITSASEVIFSWLMETAFSLMERRQSLLEGKHLDLSAKRSSTPMPLPNSAAEIVYCGTPANTARNDCSSKLKSCSFVPLPKRICEAATAVL